MALLKSQKNRLFELIVEQGLTPTDFRWAGYDEDLLEYIGPGEGAGDNFHFRIDANYVSFAPGDESPEAGDERRSWLNVESNFRLWLTCLDREVSAPDHWAEVEQLRAVVKADAVEVEGPGDTPLVGAERDQFLAALNQVRELVEARDDLTTEQIQGMRASIDRLEASSARISRKDILLLVLGNVAAPVFTGVLTVQHAQWLLIHLVHALTAVKVLAAPIVQALSG